MSKSSQGKTEQPTPNRIRKAREDGSYAVSRHLPEALSLWCWWFILLSIVPPIAMGLYAFMRSTLVRLSEPARGTSLRQIDLLARFTQIVVDNAPSMLLPAAALVVIQLMMTRFGLHSFKNSAGFKSLSPGKRISGLISNAGRTLVESVVGTALLAVLLGVIYNYFIGAHIIGAPHTIRATAASSLATLRTFGVIALAISFLLAAADYAHRCYSYMQSLKMSKQELKEENKDMNGHPEVKARLRRVRMTMSRQRMFAAIPTATVVVTNPTHYAVALKYDAGSMACPVVVALGVDHLAARIKQLARKSQVPVVEHPPLAQALYRNCSVGQQIPSSLYRAVAEVLAFVMRATVG